MESPLSADADPVRRILEGTAGQTGQAFFAALASHLATALGLRACFITECLDTPPTRVATLGFWHEQQLVERYEYDLAGTPCAAVLAGQEVVISDGVQQLFPHDLDLVRLAARSYAALPLKSATGQVIGHLAVLHDQPFADHAPDLGLLRLFTAQASVELERQRALLDSTQLKRLEKKFLQSQKMEVVGQLAGGIAHDFNNLLTGILGYGDLLRRQLAEGTTARRACEQIIEAARRGADLTRQLLAFSRRQVLQPREADLNQTIAEVEPLLRQLLRHGIQLETELAADLFAVIVDPAQMEQVLINLVVNARDAMPEGGRLSIRSGTLSVAPDDTAQAWQLPPGDYSWFAVKDSGTGIPSHIQERIFEPFFTTKDDGLGLGLAAVYGIVQQSAGTIRVASQSGVGTTFTLFFPRAEAQTTAPHKTSPLPRDQAVPGKTVLVAEDQQLVRHLVGRVLAARGYKILAAPDAESALTLAARHRGTIELLITDVVMPGDNGRELAEKLRQTRPQTRVLYMSGHTDEVLLRHGIRAGNLAFLQKPFSEEMLVRKVHEVLTVG